MNNYVKINAFELAQINRSKLSQWNKLKTNFTVNYICFVINNIRMDAIILNLNNI